MPIALVQTVSGNEKLATGNAYQNAYTFSISPTAGNTLILCLAYGSADNITIKDDKGNNWADDKGVALTGHREADIWRAYNVAGGATTVTVQADSGQYPDSAYICDEFSGLLAADALDQVGGSTTSAGTTYAAGNVTTAYASELLIGAIAAENNAPGYAGDPAWSAMLTQPAGDLYTSVARQYRIVSTADTYSWTVTNGNSYFVAQALATYKGAGVAPAGVDAQLLVSD